MLMLSSVIGLLATLGSCHQPISQIPLRTGRNSPIAQVPADAWQKLNGSVNGRLLLGVPVALPCHDNFNGQSRIPQPMACLVVERERNNTNYLVTQTSGYLQGNWGVCQVNGDGCPTSPNPNNTAVASAPCNQGAIPDYYINVQSVSDVQAALAFAHNYTVPIVVKNSGHDYKGRSAGPGTLALWIHNYRPGPTVSDNFTPEGCTSPVGNAITFGAGQGFDGLYELADQNNVTIVGGSAATVAPGGGWITGGGHSALSPVFGLGVDNVQQIRVVLPNGTYVTANHCQNQDVFFALRGGGGGTFGVNMEVTFLAHPKVTLQFVQLNFPANVDQSALTQILVENANTWFDAGWGGYAYPGGKRPVYPVQMLNPLMSSEEATESLAPLLEFAKTYNIPAIIQTYSSFYDLYLAVIKSSLTNYGNYGLAQASRLVPRSNFEGMDAQAALTNALMTASRPIGNTQLSLMLLLTTPSRAIVDRNSSISPAWRNATWHVIYTAFWDPTQVTPDQVLGMFTTVTEAMDPLRELTPGGGAYLNEGDTYEPDPVETFWGAENYAKLLQIKDELDPSRIMQVHQGIGSTPSAPLFDCYPPVRDPAPRDEL